MSDSARVPVDAASRAGAGARDGVGGATLANDSSVDDSMPPPLVHTIVSARTVQLSALAPTARGEMRIVAVEHASDRLHYWMHAHQYTLRRLELTDAGAENETASAAAGSQQHAIVDLRWAPVALFRKNFALRHRLDPRASAPSEVPLVAVAAAASDESPTPSTTSSAASAGGESNAATAAAEPPSAARVDAAVLCIYPYITSLNRSQYSGALEVLNLPAAAAGFSAALLSPDGVRLALVDLTDEVLLLRATGGSSRADASSASASASSNEWEISHELTAPRALGKRRLLAMRMVDVTVAVPVSDSRRRPTSSSSATSASASSKPAGAQHSSFLSSLFDPLNLQAGNAHFSLGLFSPLGLLFNRPHDDSGASAHRDHSARRERDDESDPQTLNQESAQPSAAGGESRARTVTKKLTFLCMLSLNIFFHFFLVYCNCVF